MSKAKAKKTNKVDDTDKIDLKGFYEQIQKVDAKKIDNSDPKNIAKIFGADDPNVGLTFRLLSRVARASKDFEQFYSFVSEGEMPTIKLNAQEMNLLKGGGTAFELTKGAWNIGRSWFQAQGGAAVNFGRSVLTSSEAATIGVKASRATFEAAQVAYANVRSNTSLAVKQAADTAYEVASRPGTVIDWGRTSLSKLFG